METLAQSGVSGNGVNYRMVIFAEEEGSGFGSTMTGRQIHIRDSIRMRTWILLKEMTAKVSEKYSPVFHLIRPYVQRLRKRPAVYSDEKFSPEKTVWDFDKIKLCSNFTLSRDLFSTEKVSPWA
mgnify:CR=1 FL=1